MEDLEVSRQAVIETVTIEEPHLVLLGAGASRAALPDGDASGQKLPLMNDFVDCVPGIRSIIGGDVQNFEEAYSLIASDPGRASDCLQLERLIYEYFAALRLPETPTLYDHL